MALTFGSLFSGIGGIDLGLERAGMQCSWQVEIEPYAQRVLAKHWPQVPRFADVREVGAHNLQRVDLIAGGFPCQDISLAGKGAGLGGERSGLWSEFHRLICELRPRFVLVENVSALLARGLGRVLGELASSGYDAEWDCIPAASVGAPHRRDRLFIVAHANGDSLRDPEQREARRRDDLQDRGRPIPLHDGAQRALAYPYGEGQPQQGGALLEERRWSCDRRDEVANADRAGLAEWEGIFSNAREELAAFERSCCTGGGVWSAEPHVGRVADGVPRRVDRLRGVGNAAVVPQVAELIGRRIVRAARA